MGDVATVWYFKNNYMCSLTTNTTVYFKSIKEHLDIAYYDTITSTLYFNELYKNRFKKAKREILLDFKPDYVSEYLEL